MSKSERSLVLILLAASLVPGPAGSVGGPIGGGERLLTRDLICSQPGDSLNVKFPSDSIEVANECEVTSPCTIVKATWWGGPMQPQAAYPDSATFDVRFYDDLVCTPDGILAEYLGVRLPGTLTGHDPDGLPCFRYDLDVFVPVASKFWMGIRYLAPSGSKLPPQWGRLGDEIFLGCGSHWRPPAFGTWFEIDNLPEYDVSHEFEVEQPTPVQSTSWGTLRGLYR